MTPLKAIHKFCVACIYDPNDKGTRHQQTENCTATECALYEYRPITDATKREKRQSIVDAMSPEERAKLDEKRKQFIERIKQ